MKKSDNHRISNWSEYNKALIHRGSLTLWFSKDILKGWKADAKKQRGCQKAIQIKPSNVA